MLADSGAAALVSTKALADGLAGVLAQPPLLAPGRPLPEGRRNLRTAGGKRH